MNEVRLLLENIDQAFDHRAWHGTNLRGSIRGVTARQASKRPAHGRHNIRELVLHCAYWKYMARRRILGDRTGSFPLRGRNWFSRDADPRTEERAWSSEVQLLVESHRRLREVVARLRLADLRRRTTGGVSVRDLVLGIGAHDVYHAGQIQLVKRIIG